MEMTMPTAKMRNWNVLRRLCGLTLTGSLAATVAVFGAQGRWIEALPLHLCCVSAILAVVLALVPSDAILTFLWTLGAPGAALALLFPAPQEPAYQTAVNVTYFLTHALIIAITAMRLAEGMRPGKAGAKCYALLQALGIAAFAVNQRFGTNYLFLAGPPAHTPLETLIRYGFLVYLLTLESVTLFFCAGMEWFAGRIL